MARLSKVQAEKDLLQTCFWMLWRCNGARQPFHASTGVWPRMLKHWQGRSTGTKDWLAQASFTIPLGHRNVEVATARLHGLLPNPVFLGTHPALDRMGEVVGNMIRRLWVNNSSLYKRVHTIRSGQIYGTVINMISYRTDARMVKRWMPVIEEDINTGMRRRAMDPVTGEPKRELDEVTVIDYAGPTADYVHIGDFWIPERCSGLNHYDAPDGYPAEYCIHRVWTTKGKLKKIAEAGATFKNLDKVGTGLLPDSFMSGYEFSLKDLYSAFHIDEQTVGANDRDEIPVQLFYFWQPDHLTVIADLSVIVYDGENPFGDGRLPFVSWRVTEGPGMFYGFPDTFFYEGLSLGYTGLANKLYDHVEKTVDPPVAYDADNIRTQHLNWGSNASIPFRLPGNRSINDAMRFIQPNQLGNEAIYLLNLLPALADDISGISPAQRGAVGSSDLATEVALAYRGGDAKFLKQANTIAETLDRPTFEMWLDRVRSFMPDSMIQDLIGAEMAAELNNLLLADNFLDIEWKVRMESYGRQPGDIDPNSRTRMLEAFNMLMATKETAGIVKLAPLVSRVLREVFGEQYPDRYIMTQKEIDDQKVQEQYMALKAMAEAYTTDMANKGAPNPVASQNPMEAISNGEQQFPVNGGQQQFPAFAG